MGVRSWVVGFAVGGLAFVMAVTAVESAEASPMLGFESSSVLAGNADRTPDLLAGSHPLTLTASFKVKTATDLEGRLVSEGGDPKDLIAELPPGLVIDPLATQRCGAEEFASVNATTEEDGCPNASAVGVLTLENVAPSMPSERRLKNYPIYDLVTPQGSPGELGSRIAGAAVYMTLSVRTGSDYGPTVTVAGIPQSAHVLGSAVALWGVPAESAHDGERGDCIQSHGSCPAGVAAKPLLTLPTQCSIAPVASLRADSWQEPGELSATASAPISGAGPLTGCGTLAFTPSFSSGMVDRQANSYSTFTTTIARQDGEQELKGLSLTLPLGLLATLSGVELCPELQASLGTCGAGSLIGEPSTLVGPGSDPTAITGGRVFLTGPYDGGPFGLSIVVPAIAGPFDLGPEGRPIVIRASIHIDPITTQISIYTDAAGPHSIPGLLDGIYPQIKAVNVTIDRPRFMFNPSNCASQAIAGAITSAQGTTVNGAVPFQAVNCASLPFSPKLTSSTVGRPSRVNGVGFDVKIVEGVAGEANARSVKVELPKQLPSRLTTL